jgi:Glyoxalase-like domain
MIGRLTCVVLDCPDPWSLAGFYQGLVGGRIRQDGDWVSLDGAGGSVDLGFQLAPDYEPPHWPEGGFGGQQLHLEVLVEDIDAAEPGVLELGARRLEHPDNPTGFRVYADPVGHPFCLVTE